MIDKALFVPLRREYFEAFEAGTKMVEWRRYGRGWHERTCYPGRRVTLSLGYSGRRLYGIVAGFRHIVADSEIYGRQADIAEIAIALDPPMAQVA